MIPKDKNMMESIFIFVRDVDLATRLRQNRLLTSSLRHEPTFKHDDPDEPFRSEIQSKKARKIARFDFEKLLPLLLTPEEATVAFELGWITLRADLNSTVLEAIPNNNNEPGVVVVPPQWMEMLQVTVNFKVFKDLWNRGLYLVEGLKFGVDYLTYAEDPLRSHAHYMILIVEDEQVKDKMRVNDMIAVVTVAVKARKTLLLAYEKGENSIEYTKLQKKQLVSRQERFQFEGGRVGGAMMSEEDLLEEVPE